MGNKSSWMSHHHLPMYCKVSVAEVAAVAEGSGVAVVAVVVSEPVRRGKTFVHT